MEQPPSFRCTLFRWSPVLNRVVAEAAFGSGPDAWSYARSWPNPFADIDRYGGDWILDVMQGRDCLRSVRHPSFAEAYAELERLAPDHFKVLRDAPKAVNGSAIID